MSIAVFGAFVIYSLAIRHQNPLIAKPASLVASTTSSSTPSTTSSSASSSTTTTTAAPTTTTTKPSSLYKDGSFNGSTQNAYWGNVQVAAIISNGKLKTVKVLQYPNSHSTSVYINQQALPYLQQEAVKSQNANIQIISGATFTSQAFIQSLSDALTSARS